MIEHTGDRVLAAHRPDDSIGAQSNLDTVLQRLGLEDERVPGVWSQRDWTS